MWDMGVKEGMEGKLFLAGDPLAVLSFAVGGGSPFSGCLWDWVSPGKWRKQEELTRMEQYWKKLTFPAAYPLSGKQAEMALSPL